MSIEVKRNSQISQDSSVYKPNDEETVSEVIKQSFKNNLPIEIVGTNSKKFIGYNIQTEKTLDLSNLNGIIEYLPEELYIKVKAGTPLNLVEQELEKNNQQLAFEPIDLGYLKDGISNKGTVGGYVACNFAGSRRFKMGSVRDHILGFKGVNGKGDIIKSGGTVVKNVTGYDLSKLITGSFGTLVALTEITLKVVPKKISQSTIVVHTDNLKKISSLFDKILSSSNEISGSIFVPDEPKNNKYETNKQKIFKFNDLKFDGSFLAFRLEGDKISIDERIKDLNKELDLKKYKTSYLDAFQSSPFWKKINNLELFSNTKNNILRAVMPLANSEKFMNYLKNKYKYYVDWSGFLFWIEVLDKDENKIKEIKNFVLENEGYITIIKRSENFNFNESLFTINDNKLFISKKIKESFDPKRIFNPGKMYREI
tara:strand:+ start:1171 stop:2448 length:1278 start_codon:yes stop_codon:yes gene_type:complete